MTRKHYRKLAAVLKWAYSEKLITKEVVYKIADMLEEDNEAFNRYKFYDAISSVDCYAL